MTGLAATPAPNGLAELRRLLSADFARVLRQTTGGKPTSRLRRLMHLTLPAMQVAIFHRTAHWLHGRGWRRCAALMSDLSLRLTGASLHPGSPIGPGLFVPHPARVVFCGSAGVDLILLPGTLVGPRDWVFPGQPFPKDAPRLGDGAVVGAHAAVQGAVTVGAGATIGIGVCTLRDVPAGTVTMLAQRQIRTLEAGIFDARISAPDERGGGIHAPLPPPSAGEGGRMSFLERAFCRVADHP
ncbi:serine acetyltransferase [Methylobacterium sp. J-048]|uniref:serine O-acetyltransferase n=1 Tax=Methylobacterium sp. J-048 TaxID=2836635 RepID=UPI001FBA34F0|nr:serine acetyltransferase [Methylobacterium sp. J-048]MCJ2055394.1 serine acetyltransferase [Methylobacterium sp. J-048]